MLEGPDVNIEISLKEYGIAWEIGSENTKFYYGISADGNWFTRFDWVYVENDLDVIEEFDWVDFDGVTNFLGMTLNDWIRTPLVYKIMDLVDYYGRSNILGESYTSGISYENIVGED